MAIVEIIEPATTSPQSADWTLFIENIILKTKGLNAVSITEGFTSDEPVIEMGSSWEIDDKFYYVNEDEGITGWSGIVDGDTWIYTDGTQFFYSSDIPVFDVDLRGWFNTGDRALYKLEKSGATGWKYKSRMPVTPERIQGTFADITIQRDMNVSAECYAVNIITPVVGVTEYAEMNGGTVVITTLQSSGTVAVTGTTTISGTFAPGAEIQNAPDWGNNVWIGSNGISGGWWFSGAGAVWAYPVGFYCMTGIRPAGYDGGWLQIYTGSSWVGSYGSNSGFTYYGAFFFGFGKTTNYRIYAGRNFDAYYREYQ